MMNKKILICGKGRSGKDTLCEILRDKYGMTFASSSWTAAGTFIFDKLKKSHNYQSVSQCFNDRHRGENRKLWYDLITEYNHDDPAKLAKIITSKNDIYCGLRSKTELEECMKQGVVDLTYWVDASDRVSYKEGSDSITITKDDCMHIINNNGTIEELERHADQIYQRVIM